MCVPLKLLDHDDVPRALIGLCKANFPPPPPTPPRCRSDFAITFPPPSPLNSHFLSLSHIQKPHTHGWSAGYWEGEIHVGRMRKASLQRHDGPPVFPSTPPLFFLAVHFSYMNFQTGSAHVSWRHFECGVGHPTTTLNNTGAYTDLYTCDAFTDRLGTGPFD